MPEVASPLLPRWGLRTATSAPVPLERVAVHAAVQGATASVRIVQRYRNGEAVPIEAVYTFPLTEGAAVCGFEAVVAGVTFRGVVLDRDEAFAKYDDAIQEGHGAFLVDEERADVFTASVGNVPPGGDVELRLTYVTELQREGEALRFTLPTTIGPRYAPPSDRLAVGRSDADALNPPLRSDVPYGLSLDVDLSMPGPITRLESPSHALACEMHGATGRVSLAQRDVALDRDVVVLIGAEGLAVPSVSLERDAEGRQAAAVTFLPTFKAAPGIRAEVVFVVDRSGSMEGPSIAEVRNALQLCLRSLQNGCTFDIVSFGDRCSRLFDGSRPYDDASLAEASEHVASMKANFGGTEILPALEAVLTAPPVKGMLRQVIVLTDGQVTNTDAVIALVRRHGATTRVFAFGIGHGASEHLVRGIARAGNGVAEFIAPGERIEAKVMRQFARVLAPAVTDVRVDWGGLEVTQAPRAVPPLFSDTCLRLYGFLKEPARATVTLSGRTVDGPVSWALTIDPDAVRDGRTVGTLAARARIRELEEDDEWTAARGSAQARARRRSSTVTDEIVRLARAYTLVSRETSFVAVEQRDNPLQGDVQLRRIPVALSHGWGGEVEVRAHRSGWSIGRAMAPAPPPSVGIEYLTAQNLMPGAPEPDQPPPGIDAAQPRSGRFAGSLSRLLRKSQELARPTAAGATPRPATARGARPLDVLVSLQRADGSWTLTPALLDAVGIPRSLASRLAGAFDADALPALATALALQWLRRRAADAEAEWRMLADKARAWLATVPPPKSGEDWLAVAEVVMTRGTL